MSKQLDMDQPVDIDELLDMDDLVDRDDLETADELVAIDEPLEGDEEYYFDSHPTEEELMPEASVHARLIRYLIAVLEQLFAGEICAIHQNLNFYQTPALYEHPTAPDIALVKGASWEEIRSWKIDRTGPPPQVVVEIASEETWKNDRKKKPALYASMGVLEYFLYDPNTPPCWPQPKRRLLGWRWNPVSQRMRRLASDRKGRIWSEQLDSWLVPDGSYLRLHDRQHHLRLTEAEAQTLRASAEARRAEEERRRADAEAEARQAEAKRAEEERARAAAEAKRAEEERRRAEAEAEARQAAVRRAEELAEKLRALGINPDEIA